MAASLDPELERLLASGRLGPFPVLLEFEGTVTARDLGNLPVTLEGNQARGWLEKAVIEAIANLPPVRSIALTELPPPQPRREEYRGPKITYELAADLADPDRDLFPVVVTFREPQGHDVRMEGLIVFGDTGTGVLGREAIEALAARDEVVKIDRQPEFEISSMAAL